MTAPYSSHQHRTATSPPRAGSGRATHRDKAWNPDRRICDAARSRELPTAGIMAERDTAARVRLHIDCDEYLDRAGQRDPDPRANHVAE